MLQNMFVGSPPGNYDRLLDFSRAVTGNLFFVPSQSMLDGLDSLESQATEAGTIQPAAPGPAASAGSLTIGSLRGGNSR
jgi:putative iron-dependent peroxidase